MWLFFNDENVDFLVGKPEKFSGSAYVSPNQQKTNYNGKFEGSHIK